MGVLGWPPSVVMRDADIDDLVDAFEGFALHHGREKASPPPKDFLAEMLKKFPDMKGM